MWLSRNLHRIDGRTQPKGSREVVFNTEEFMIWRISQTT